MFSSLVTVAAFVASVSAIAVTSPGTTSNWTNDGSQSITWTSVSTDPANFTIVLTNNRSLMPTNNQILKALYRVNFCKDSEDLNTILAQSDEFNITAAPVQSSASTTSFHTAATTATTATTGVASVTDGSGASDSATESAPAATGTGAAAPSISVHTGFIGALVLLGAMLA
ncbi:hypothetical protein FB451DRAFT_1202836 [Mycena latifolia]|nr:hypothetical protein FB451DRAFT_1202836 [Mycena latifolia]